MEMDGAEIQPHQTNIKELRAHGIADKNRTRLHVVSHNMPRIGYLTSFWYPIRGYCYSTDP